jgi:hypothetical protein
MNVDFLQKNWIEGMIVHNKVFVENEVLVLIDMFHSLFHPLFEIDGRTFPPLKELLIIQLDSNISKN